MDVGGGCCTKYTPRKVHHTLHRVVVKVWLGHGTTKSLSRRLLIIHRDRSRRFETPPPSVLPRGPLAPQLALGPRDLPMSVAVPRTDRAAHTQETKNVSTQRKGITLSQIQSINACAYYQYYPAAQHPSVPLFRPRPRPHRRRPPQHQLHAQPHRGRPSLRRSLPQ